MKVLIIGATGGTGRILLDKALEQGHEVTSLARNPSAVAPRDYRPRVLRRDALDPDAVAAAVAEQTPDEAVNSPLGQPLAQRLWSAGCGAGIAPDSPHPLPLPTLASARKSAPMASLKSIVCSICRLFSV